MLSAGEHSITAVATDSTGATGSDTIRLRVVDTGAAAPRLQGAVPDAERRLLAGSAVLPAFGWLMIALIAVAAVVVLLAGAWLVARWRRARVTASP
jgi:hypothetical protein